MPQIHLEYQRKATSKEMDISLFDELDKVTDAELRHDLLMLPQWRRSQALAYRNLTDRIQSAKAFILLQQCLARRYELHDIPPFEYGPYGKPSLPNVHFNMSHCRKGVICVVDDRPVGCDIEVIPRTVDTDLLAACFNDDEQHAIANAKSPTAKFAQLWTTKEAFLKLTGTGLVDDLPHVLGSPLATSVRFHTVTAETKGYVYTIAQYEKNNEQACL